PLAERGGAGRDPQSGKGSELEPGAAPKLGIELQCPATRLMFCLENRCRSSCGGQGPRWMAACRPRRDPLTISPTLHKYLAAENIEYDEIPHALTMSSAHSAQASHVSGDRLAKAIVLRRDGGYMLAVLPASHHLRLEDLRAKFGDDIAM